MAQTEMNVSTYAYAGDYLESDDSIWLGGRLVAVARGHLVGSTQSRASETGECYRPEMPAGSRPSCGIYLIVNDALPKPILAVEKATARITGAALYDEFGQINRIPFVSGNLTDDGLLGRVSLPGGTVSPRPFWRRLQSPVVFEGGDPYGNTQEGWLAAQWGPWALTNGASASATVGGYSPFLTQIEAIEYRRYDNQAIPWFPNLRFPGQHWDEETDLFENWNRYYDSGSGRYFSPEPLLQSPSYVRRMAQSGMSVPTYAYGLNNPIRYVDADGLRISTTVNVSYNYAAGAPSPFGPRPGTTLQTLSGSWSAGCKPENGKWKFDASVVAEVTVELNGEGNRRSLHDSNECSIGEHEEKHVSDAVDGVSEIEEHFPSEGFRSKAACDEAFRRFANDANIKAYGHYVQEASRSLRDPFDFAR